MGDNKEKGRVCVTGGNGFIASSLIKRLLLSGYSVNTTVRNYPDTKRDLSFLTNLPNASEKMKIFSADLSEPESFSPAINGCVGVIHVLHPMGGEETDKMIEGLLILLKACIESTTVKRFIHTSSTTTVAFDGKDLDERDESSWSDVDFLRISDSDSDSERWMYSYAISKTLAERTVLEFGQEHGGLEVVSLLPTWVHGSFLTPTCPESVRVSLSFIFGDGNYYSFIMKSSFVHVDDVAGAFVHLLECPKVEGRYICSGVDITADELLEFLSRRYPEFQLPTTESLKGVKPVEVSGFSSKKLLESGFKFEYGLEEMFDGAIQSCREKGIL